MEVFTRTDGLICCLMTRAEATKLFHDTNRTMAVLDDLRANADDGMVEDMDAEDQAAYARLAEALGRQLPPGERT